MFYLSFALLVLALLNAPVIRSVFSLNIERSLARGSLSRDKEYSDWLSLSLAFSKGPVNFGHCGESAGRGRVFIREMCFAHASEKDGGDR